MGRRSCEAPSSAFYGINFPQAVLDIAKKKSNEFLVKKFIERVKKQKELKMEDLIYLRDLYDKLIFNNEKR